MRLATWNINGIRARLGFLLGWLEARQPDVLGIQELKIATDQLPLIELGAAGYHVVAHGQRGWNGVAILSREPAQVVQVGLPGQDEAGARLLTADVGGVRFTTLYGPNGKHLQSPDFPMKLAWLDALNSHVAATVDLSRPAVFCGDFNLVPTPLDTWSEAQLGGGIHHTEFERSRFRRLADAGLMDPYRRLYPDEPGFTWWDYRAGAVRKNQGLRIDFLLATPPLAARITQVVPDREWRAERDHMIPSDHAPLYADID